MICAAIEIRLAWTRLVSLQWQRTVVLGCNLRTQRKWPIIGRKRRLAQTATCAVYP